MRAAVARRSNAAELREAIDALDGAPPRRSNVDDADDPCTAAARAVAVADRAVTNAGFEMHFLCAWSGCVFLNILFTFWRHSKSNRPGVTAQVADASALAALDDALTAAAPGASENCLAALERALDAAAARRLEPLDVGGPRGNRPLGRAGLVVPEDGRGLAAGRHVDISKGGSRPRRGVPRGYSEERVAAPPRGHSEGRAAASPRDNVNGSN